MYSFRNTTRVSADEYVEDRGYPFSVRRGSADFATLDAKFGSMLQIGQTAVHGQDENSWEVINGFPMLDDAKASAIEDINKKVSAKIFAGFDYAVNGVSYHFSFDELDQLNFESSAKMADLQGIDGVPSSIVWNGYDSNGKLVRLNFTAEEFKSLYIKGAMAHKARVMLDGGAQKERVMRATTFDEIKAALA